jgi:radical SAM protein with 4Fe4S-binding SPASM domain
MAGEALSPDDPVLTDAFGMAVSAAAECGIAFVDPSTGTAPGGTGRGRCRYPEGWVFIDPDGMVFPCPYWNVSGPLGDLSSQSFDEVWKGQPYSALRKRLADSILDGNCAVCPEMGARGIEIVKVGSGKAVKSEEG